MSCMYTFGNNLITRLFDKLSELYINSLQQLNFSSWWSKIYKNNKALTFITLLITTVRPKS